MNQKEAGVERGKDCRGILGTSRRPTTCITLFGYMSVKRSSSPRRGIDCESRASIREKGVERKASDTVQKVRSDCDDGEGRGSGRGRERDREREQDGRGNERGALTPTHVKGEPLALGKSQMAIPSRESDARREVTVSSRETQKSPEVMMIEEVACLHLPFRGVTMPTEASHPSHDRTLACRWHV